MARIVELNAEEISEVVGGGIISWLEDVFGEDPPEPDTWIWTGGKG